MSMVSCVNHELVIDIQLTCMPARFRLMLIARAKYCRTPSLDSAEARTKELKIWNKDACRMLETLAPSLYPERPTWTVLSVPRRLAVAELISPCGRVSWFEKYVFAMEG